MSDFRLSGRGFSYSVGSSNETQVTTGIDNNWYFYTDNDGITWVDVRFTGSTSIDNLCPYCGSWGGHGGAIETCSRIEAIEYFEDGTISAIRFKRDR